MGNIRFTCPQCYKDLQADDEFCGLSSQCPHCGSDVKIPMPGLEEGVTIANFELIRRIGIGGMGEVWLSRQLSMDRNVALKILSPSLAHDHEFTDRFLKEAKYSAKLDHPNIITAYDAGMDKGMYYLALSYVDGKELKEKLVRNTSLPEAEALKYAREISSALDYAWNEFKLLHRDIKPANIMVDKKGNSKLMDMGISKSFADDSSLTTTGVVVGTPYYMSPEQARADKTIDFRADIYSLGATLYHMVTGDVPYDSTTALGVITKHVTEPLPNPRGRNPQVSKECASLLETMMAKNRTERQESWKLVIADIDRVLEHKVPLTHLPKSGTTLKMPSLDKLNLPPPSAQAKPPPIRKVRETGRMNDPDATQVEFPEHHQSSRHTQNKMPPLEPIENNEKKRQASNLPLIISLVLFGAALIGANILLAVKFLGKPEKEVQKNPEPVLEKATVKLPPGRKEKTTRKLAELTAAADKGDVKAMEELTDIYFHGRNGVKIDYPQAFKWCKMNAEKGVPKAQAFLAYLYRHGLGTKKDMKMAVKWYQRAAKAGNADAQAELGHFHETGEGVRKNLPEAVKLYKLAAAKGQPVAQYSLACLYSKGQGVETNPGKAIELLQKSAKTGYPPAQAQLGLCYAKGNGVKKSYAKAKELFTKAAETGNPLAQCKLGIMYRNGIGVSKNTEKAVRLFRASAQQGNADAQCSLGEICMDKSLSYYAPRQAVRWLRAAAHQGSADAFNNLGILFENGIGVPKNYNEAIRMYLRASRHGNPVARENMVRLEKKMRSK